MVCGSRFVGSTAQLGGGDRWVACFGGAWDRCIGRAHVIYSLLKYVLLGPWLRAIFRPIVEGREHIPAEGPAILASNHLSFSDSIFMPLMVKRRVTFVAK